MDYKESAERDICMKILTKEQYYALPTIRKMRRRIRRTIRRLNPPSGIRTRITFKDEQNADMLKTRRVKNRFYAQLCARKSINYY